MEWNNDSPQLHVLFHKVSVVNCATMLSSHAAAEKNPGAPRE